MTMTYLDHPIRSGLKTLTRLLLLVSAVGCETTEFTALYDDTEDPVVDDFQEEGLEADAIVVARYTPDYDGLTYRVPGLSGLEELPITIQGDRILHGDIILGTVEDLHRQQQEDLELANGAPFPISNPAAATLTPWPQHTIPFDIDSASIPLGDARRAVIAAGVNRWNSQTQINLRPRTLVDVLTNAGFVRFENNTFGACQAQSGYGGVGVARKVSLGTGCSAENVIHELGHVVGLKHEQARPDRDANIAINWSVVPGGFLNWNFSTAGVGFGPYDFNSRMQYGNYAFSTNPAVMTMRRIGCAEGDVSASCTLGGTSFTPGDTAGLRRIQDGASPSNRTRYQNVASSLCLRSTGDHRTPGSRLSQSSCSFTASRLWYNVQVPRTNTVSMVHSYSRLCVNRSGGYETLGACSNSTSNRLIRRTVSPGVFRLEIDGRCLERSSGNNVRAVTCNTSTAQQWRRLG